MKRYKITLSFFDKDGNPLGEKVKTDSLYEADNMLQAVFQLHPGSEAKASITPMEK